MTSLVVYQTANTWDHCLALMPASFRARELLASYSELEDLYRKRAGVWLVWWTCPQARRYYGQLEMRIIEKKIEIKQLGGRIPPFWSVS